MTVPSYTFTRETKCGWKEKIKALLTGKKLKTPDFVDVGDFITDWEGKVYRVTEVKLDFEGRDFYSYTATLEKVEK